MFRLLAPYHQFLINIKGILSILSLLIFIGCQPKKVEEFNLVVKEISPSEGLRTGGETIVLSGSGLTYLKSVTVDGEECESLDISSDRIARCTVPAHAPGEVEVVALNSIGEAVIKNYTYLNTPTISGIEPSVGVESGGTHVVISGEGFEENAVVFFGDAECENVDVINETTLECDTTSHDNGFVTTTITNPSGKTGTGSFFSYGTEPTISSISPTGGNTLGNTLVTIGGSGFSEGASVSIGGSECLFVEVVTSSMIRCRTTAHAAATVEVEVTNNTGLSGESSSIYTYRLPPTISSFSPSEARASGSPSTTVTINGSNFLASPVVKIGNSTCTVTTSTSTEITCNTTSSVAGSFQVNVINSDEQPGFSTAFFTFIPPPTISTVSPDTGSSSGGEEITITGSNFSTTVDPTVTVGGVTCTVDGATNTANQIKCETGPYASGSDDVDVVVTNSDGQTGTKTDGYSYRALPTLASITPNAGALAGGTEVTLSGTNFADGAIVKIGETECSNVAFVNSTTLTCTTTTNSVGIYSVAVENDDGQISTESVSFTYQEGPTLASINPSRGILAGNTFVTLTGTNFRAGATVEIGDESCTSVSIISSTEMTCRTPLTTISGPVNVTVTNLDQQSVFLSAGYNYQNIMLDWSKDGLDVTTFDYEAANTLVSQEFTLTNSTASASTANIDISIGGEDPGLWDTGTTTCGTTLAVGASCSVTFTFQGLSNPIGSYEGILIVETDTGESDTVEIQGQIVDAQLEWDVGGVEFSDDSSQTFTLTNVGESTTSEISITETTGVWTIVSNGCTSTLAPSASCTVTVKIEVPLTGQTGTLRANANAGGQVDKVLQAASP